MVVREVAAQPGAVGSEGVKASTILIDGYNVIRNIPGLARADTRSLAAGREALLAQVVAHYRGTAHRILVVFDGAAPAQHATPLRCGSGSQCIFSAAGETADSVIVRLAESERARGAAVVVATNDWAVRVTSQHAGATTASVNQMATRLHAAPRDLEKRSRFRRAVRAQWERDEPPRPAGPRKGNGHRAPRRHRGAPPEPPL